MQQDICLGVYRYGYVFVYMRLSVGLCVFFCIYVPVFAYAFYDFNVFCDFRAFYLSARVQVSFCLYHVGSPNVTFYTPALQSTSCMHPASRRDGGSWMFVCVPSPCPSHIGAHPV